MPLTPSTFFASQLLHQATFTPDTFYTRHLYHPFCQTPLYNKRLLHQTPLAPDNFYTRDLLHQTPFTPETFTPETFFTLHWTPFTPQTVACATMPPRFATWFRRLLRSRTIQRTKGLPSLGRMCRGSDTDSRTLRAGCSFRPLYHHPLFDTTGEEPQFQPHSRLRCRFIPLYQNQSFGATKWKYMKITSP